MTANVYTRDGSVIAAITLEMSSTRGRIGGIAVNDVRMPNQGRIATENCTTNGASVLFRSAMKMRMKSTDVAVRKTELGRCDGFRGAH